MRLALFKRRQDQCFQMPAQLVSGNFLHAEILDRLGIKVNRRQGESFARKNARAHAQRS